MELHQRIFKARSDAKMTQEELAKAVGKTRSAVAQWESGDVRPRHTTLIAIAQATKTNFAWLLHGGEGGREARIGLPVVGEVAAGMWREGNVTFERGTQPVAAHPDYPAHAQRLYRVSGTSINLVALPGEYLHTVDVKAIGLQPEHGDLVIVCRTQHGLAEYTAKQMVWKDGEWFLKPESSDPDWQELIRVDDAKGADVEVTDIVIAKWKPIARRRPVAKNSIDVF